MVNANDSMDVIRDALGLSGVRKQGKWKAFKDFLREKLDGKKWSMYTEDEQSLLWDEIEKYGTEKGLGLDEKKLKVVDTLLRKISRSRKPSAETPEARSSDTGVYDPVKNAWIERKDTE